MWGVPNISFFRSAFSISIIFIFRIVRTWDKPTVAKHMQKNRIVKMIVSGKSINENSNGLWYIWSSIAVMNWENTPPNPIPTISEKIPIISDSTKKSRAIVDCSIPIILWIANSLFRRCIIKWFTYCIRNISNTVINRIAYLIPSPNISKLNSAPIFGS